MSQRYKGDKELVEHKLFRLYDGMNLLWSIEGDFPLGMTPLERIAMIRDKLTALIDSTKMQRKNNEETVQGSTSTGGNPDQVDS